MRIIFWYILLIILPGIIWFLCGGNVGQQIRGRRARCDIDNEAGIVIGRLP